MSRVSRWLHQRGSIWIRFLEVLVRTLNTCLLVLGCLTLAWSIYTGIMLQKQGTDPAGPSDTDPVISLQPWSSYAVPFNSSVTSSSSSSSSNAIKCPWFVPAIGVVGGATALSALLAIVASCMRSIACMAAHIFVMSAVLTVQACVAAGFYVDTSWQDQLPQEEEAIKEWLEARLEVCKWVGVGLVVLQLLTLMGSCLLHGAYTTVDEVAEEADEEEAARRQPLLRAQQTGAAYATQRSTAAAAAAVRASMAPSETAEWAAHMRQQYGLDPTQFGEGRRAQEAGDGDRQGRGGRSCAIM